MKAMAKTEPTRTRCEVLRFQARFSSVGNPDFGQYAPVSDPVVVRTATLKEMRVLIEKYIAFWDLGGGNFVDPIVKRDGKKIGRFSYNGRFWRSAKRNPSMSLTTRVVIPD